MHYSTELTLEQQFQVKCFELDVQQMSQEQAQDFLVIFYEQMLIRETMYRCLMLRSLSIQIDINDEIFDC